MSEPAASRDIAPGTAVDGMAAGEGAVWTFDDRARAGVAYRSGPWARRSLDQSRRPSGFHTFSSPVTTGARSVWVVKGSSTVARIDPARRRGEADIGVGNDPSGIAAREGGVWVADVRDDTVTRIDPKTNGVVTTIPVRRGASGIAAARAAFGSLTRLTTRSSGSIPTPTRSRPRSRWARRRRASRSVLARCGSQTTVTGRCRGSTRERAMSRRRSTSARAQALVVAGDAVWVSVQATPPSLREPVPGERGRSGADGPERGGELLDGERVDGPGGRRTLCDHLRDWRSPARLPRQPVPGRRPPAPDVARAMPEVSDGGRTYTYRLATAFASPRPLISPSPPRPSSAPSSGP